MSSRQSTPTQPSSSAKQCSRVHHSSSALDVCRPSQHRCLSIASEHNSGASCASQGPDSGSRHTRSDSSDLSSLLFEEAEHVPPRTVKAKLHALSRRALQRLLSTLRVRAVYILLHVVGVVILIGSFVGLVLLWSKPKPPLLAVLPEWNPQLTVVVPHDGHVSVPGAREQHTLWQTSDVDLAVQTRQPSTPMTAHQLPSWTLHTVTEECTECLDSHTYDNGFERTLTNPVFSVYATPQAPLGMVGPMLLAMASVTDEVDAETELAKWSWVPRSYAMRQTLTGVRDSVTAVGTRSHLVVMGIPTTDQPVRAAMRAAQRDTWLTYSEVARSGNDFHGALLPLYIFAAAERSISHGVTDMSPLLPTIGEYEKAAAFHAARSSGVTSPAGYVLRRVTLREDWRKVESPTTTTAAVGRRSNHKGGAEHASPCVGIVSTAVTASETGRTTPMADLSATLSLPVTPPAVAPAEFICHASTALWQEALAHRNVLWIDMLTDRRATSKKKLGEGGNWGLPVEVGMSQKLILWLEYAYHAFPDVPYIMKGDDDAYVKVPQYLSDLAHLKGGWWKPRSAAVTTSSAKATLEDDAAPSLAASSAAVEEKEECLYWGKSLLFPEDGSIRYHQGSGFLMHRRLIQAALEPVTAANRLIVRLATTDYNASFAELYESLQMQCEDVLLGRMLRDATARAEELCPHRRFWYVSEPYRPRFHDLRRGEPFNITANSLIVHHCRPADFYYVHHYFHEEHNESASIRTATAITKAAEAAAMQRGTRWAMEQVPNTTAGYGNVPPTRWLHVPSHFPEFSVVDGVAVYRYPFLRVHNVAAERSVKPFLRSTLS